MSNAGQPNEKPTVKFEPPPDWAIALSEKVASGFQRVDARFDAVEANQELQGGQVLDLGQRMTALEGRVGKVETGGSLRAKVDTESQVNQEQNAAIGVLVSDVGELKTTQATLVTDVGSLKTALAQNSATTDAIKATLTGFLKEHPSLVASAVTLITTAIGAATAWFAAKGH